MDIVIPNLAESVTEGDLGRWLKRDGERVERDDLILELETDKATVELAAEASGMLEILVSEGNTVHVGDVVGRIVEGETGGEETRVGSTPEGRKKPEEAREEPPASAEKREPEDVGAEQGNAEASGSPAPAPEQVERGAVRERGERPEPGPHEPPASGAEPGTRRERMTRLRRRIAERLVEAQRTAAILTTFNEIDMSEVLSLRKEQQAAFEERHGVRLGFMSLFARASILALRDIPRVNAFIEGDEIVFHDHVHLGIAVGTPRGLVVPVLRHAERMSFAEIEREIKDLATRARDGELGIEELQGGTFTISNGGIYGSLMSTPILNPPQSGILGMHKVEKRAVVLTDPETGDERIVSRPMMYVALSYDHRIVDGEEAVTFLVKVKERLESPVRLLLDS